MSLAVRVIPCLDVAGGRVVKGLKFENLRDAGDPVEAARRYEAEGADELCFLDAAASHEGRGRSSTSSAASPTSSRSRSPSAAASAPSRTLARSSRRVPTASR